MQTHHWVALVCVIVGPLAFFTPTIVAFRRGLINRRQILLLNLFLGGTGIGWMIAMLYAIQPMYDAGSEA